MSEYTGEKYSPKLERICGCVLLRIWKSFGDVRFAVFTAVRGEDDIFLGLGAV